MVVVVKFKIRVDVVKTSAKIEHYCLKKNCLAMVRDIWNLPRNTLKYFIENISESKHSKPVIIQQVVLVLSAGQ